MIPLKKSCFNIKITRRLNQRPNKIDVQQKKTGNVNTLNPAHLPISYPLLSTILTQATSYMQDQYTKVQPCVLGSFVL